ncbi:hypothetical protein PAL_GLEAN10024660 [Pteropus alecto]|uniref:Uncharacterized protein n=1 Tax=Pteropus alecto TaxID=9402 RepID=L5K1K7_PTEAL|nr:hypothetical protein PAL_GLEAN10024660 [Pteropus alecto]
MPERCAKSEESNQAPAGLKPQQQRPSSGSTDTRGWFCPHAQGWGPSPDPPGHPVSTGLAQKRLWREGEQDRDRDKDNGDRERS